MKLWQRIDWLVLVFILLVFVFSFLMIPVLPEKVPTHWNIRGEVDAYGSKYINLFLMPAMAFFVYLLMSFLPAIDPLRKNYDKFAKQYQYFKFFLAAFFIYLHFVIVYSSMKAMPLKGNLIFALPFSILFILIGRVLPKLQRNFFIGIRTPWTLVSDLNWKKTHEFGSKVFIVAGVLSLVAAFFGSAISFIVLISSILLAAVAAMVYSYLIFKKEKSKP